MNILLPFLISLFSYIPNQQENTKIFTDKRDGNTYSIVQLNELLWLGENLRYRSPSAKDTLAGMEGCGLFYLVEDAKNACPKGWRLPTKKEVSALIKADKKGKIHLSDTLNILLCGRIDYDKHAKQGEQNTFWLNESVENGHVTHWHTFGKENELHSHDVVNAKRKFPVRCVCEAKQEDK
jgi:hypothetical protein